MFCIYCGKEIPDGTVCPCRTAGTDNTAAPVARQPQADDTAAASTESAPYSEFSYTGTPDNNYNNVYNNNYNSFNNMSGSPVYNNTAANLNGRQLAIKAAFASPLLLIAAILYSAGAVCSLINNFSFSIFTILSLVALWTTYAGARKNTAPKSTGLTIASGLTITQIVLMSIAYISVAAVLILFACIPVELSDGYAEISKYINQNFSITMPATVTLSSAIFIILLVVWTCMFVFIVFYYATLRSSIVSIRSELNNETPKHGINMFPLVILILSSLSSIGSSIYTFTRLDRYNDIINEILNYSFSSSGINYKINYHFGPIGPIGSILTAVSMILIAVVFINLKSSLKKAE